MYHWSEDDTNCNGHTCNGPRTLRKSTKRVGNPRTNPNFNIVKLGQNTVKSPGDLRISVVTHTLVKYYGVKKSQEVT